MYIYIRVCVYAHNTTQPQRDCVLPRGLLFRLCSLRSCGRVALVVPAEHMHAVECCCARCVLHSSFGELVNAAALSRGSERSVTTPAEGQE